MQGGRAEAGDGSRLVQRVPPVHREFHDGDVHHADQRQDRAGAGAAFHVVEGAGQCGVAEPEEEEDEHGEQTRVAPDPPGAPHRLAPDGAGEQAEGGDGGADGGELAREEVGQRVAPDQRRHRGGGERHVAPHGQPGHGHVDVEDPHRLALLVVRRREGEAPDHADAEHDHRRGPEPRHRAPRQPQEAAGVGEPVQGPPRQGGGGGGGAGVHGRHIGDAASG